MGGGEGGGLTSERIKRNGPFGAAAWKLFGGRVTLVGTNVAAVLLINTPGSGAARFLL